jgi:hypothetical protein
MRGDSKINNRLHGVSARRPVELHYLLAFFRSSSSSKRVVSRMSRSNTHKSRSTNFRTEETKELNDAEKFISCQHRVTWSASSIFALSCSSALEISKHVSSFEIAAARVRGFVSSWKHKAFNFNFVIREVQKTQCTHRSLHRRFTQRQKLAFLILMRQKQTHLSRVDCFHFQFGETVFEALCNPRLNCREKFCSLQTQDSCFKFGCNRLHLQKIFRRAGNSTNFVIHTAWVYQLLQKRVSVLRAAENLKRITN